MKHSYVAGANWKIERLNKENASISLADSWEFLESRTAVINKAAQFVEKKRGIVDKILDKPVHHTDVYNEIHALANAEKIPLENAIKEWKDNILIDQMESRLRILREIRIKYNAILARFCQFEDDEQLRNDFILSVGLDFPKDILLGIVNNRFEATSMLPRQMHYSFQSREQHAFNTITRSIHTVISSPRRYTISFGADKSTSWYDTKIIADYFDTQIINAEIDFMLWKNNEDIVIENYERLFNFLNNTIKSGMLSVDSIPGVRSVEITSMDSEAIPKERDIKDRKIWVSTMNSANVDDVRWKVLYGDKRYFKAPFTLMTDFKSTSQEECVLGAIQILEVPQEANTSRLSIDIQTFPTALPFLITTINELFIAWKEECQIEIKSKRESDWTPKYCRLLGGILPKTTWWSSVASIKKEDFYRSMKENYPVNIASEQDQQK